MGCLTGLPPALHRPTHNHEPTRMHEPTRLHTRTLQACPALASHGALVTPRQALSPASKSATTPPERVMQPRLGWRRAFKQHWLHAGSEARAGEPPALQHWARMHRLQPLQRSGRPGIQQCQGGVGGPGCRRHTASRKPRLSPPGTALAPRLPSSTCLWAGCGELLEVHQGHTGQHLENMHVHVMRVFSARWRQRHHPSGRRAQAGKHPIQHLHAAQVQGVQVQHVEIDAGVGREGPRAAVVQQHLEGGAGRSQGGEQNQPLLLTAAVRPCSLGARLHARPTGKQAPHPRLLFSTRLLPSPPHKKCTQRTTHLGHLKQPRGELRPGPPIVGH